jgi:hypothetical protein
VSVLRGPKGTCVDCGAPVASSQTAVYEVRGYVSERRGGGANHVREQQRVDGRIWHEPCFDSWLRRDRGRGTQGALL